jgi:hypothetical protein
MRTQDFQAAPGKVIVLERLLNTGIFRAACHSADIPSGKKGYALGCELFVFDAATASVAKYINTGSATSCTFTLFDPNLPLNRPVAAGAATLTVTQTLHDGKTILLDQATGTAVTLPAMTGTGARYRFFVSTTKSGGSDVITATGAHLFGGIVQNNDTGGTGLFGVSMATNAAGSTTITLNGTTTGGRKGDWFEIEDVATGVGVVRGFLNGSGTEATPFA